MASEATDSLSLPLPLTTEAAGRLSSSSLRPRSLSKASTPETRFARSDPAPLAGGPEAQRPAGWRGEAAGGRAEPAARSASRAFLAIPFGARALQLRQVSAFAQFPPEPQPPHVQCGVRGPRRSLCPPVAASFAIGPARQRILSLFFISTRCTRQEVAEPLWSVVPQRPRADPPARAHPGPPPHGAGARKRQQQATAQGRQVATLSQNGYGTTIHPPSYSCTP